MNFRSLGVHVSKVRSLTLDQWEPETGKVRTALTILMISSNLSLELLFKHDFEFNYLNNELVNINVKIL